MTTHKLLLAAGTAGLLVSAQSSLAASIGVNLSGDADADRNLAAGQTAGVVVQGNWNNLSGLGKVLTQTNAIDDSGAATTADFIFTTPGSGSVQTPDNASVVGSAPADAELFNYGAFMSANTGSTLESIITISEIPYAVYDVILYIGRNHQNTGLDDRVWRYRLGTQDIYAGETNDGTAFTSYILATGTDYSAADANYGIFSNVSGSSITIQGAASTGRETLSAIQIVEVVPEPGSLALMGLGGLLILRRRRG